MTFGADGIAAAFLLLVAVGVLGAGFVLGIVLSLIGWRRSGRGRALRWIGGGLVLLPFALVLLVWLWAQANSDPDPLTLDLRHNIAVKSLPGHEFPGFPAFDYDTGHVDLRLGDGSRFRTAVDKVVVWTHGDRAGSVELRQDVTTLAGARRVATSWAGRLQLPLGDLKAQTSDWTVIAGSEWHSRRGGRSVSIDKTGRGRVIIWADIAVPDEPPDGTTAIAPSRSARYGVTPWATNAG